MDQEPDRLRQDIESTRASLTRDVDRLADKTSPKRVAQRRWSSVKERVMGSSDQVRGTAGDVAHGVKDSMTSVKDSVTSAPHAVTQQAQGNPLAAGVIAFGVGLLAASLFPVTDTERRAGRQIKDNAGDLTDRAKDIARDMKDDVSGSVQQAAAEVKGTAREAAQTTRQEASPNLR